MLFYDCKVRYKLGKKSTLDKEMKEKPKKDWGDDILQDINDHLNENSDEEKIAAIVYRINKDFLHLLIVTLSLEQLCPDDVYNYVKKHLPKECDLTEFLFESFKEITPYQANKLYNIADNSDYTSYHIRLDKVFGPEHQNISLDYFRSDSYKVQEYMLPDIILSKEKAITAAKKMMLDETFITELKRIYHKQNPKEFFGHPVHYKISANNGETALEMARLLCQALFANSRLVSQCFKRISEISETCYDLDELRSLISQSAGGSIIMELCGSNDYHKNYASAYEEVVKNISILAKKHQLNTLFIFVEITDKPGFTTNLIDELGDELFIVELKEGTGNLDTALNYLEELASKNTGFNYTKDELLSALGNKTAFRPSDVQHAYESLYRGSLRNKTYPAYRQAVTLSKPKLTITDKDAYQTLQDMIGLTKVKELTKQILSTAKIQKLRSDYGLAKDSVSLHMVFTGNPGSAKTTVARLLAEILSHEGVLTSGKFLECGRADLVGRYVGWTAPSVEKHFRMARGGILFIDEAYSLVDEHSGSFSDEAINTIVQEMENHRDDTIVIFAGYPDKMKNFLEKNEGLKSRIAFHLDFPDYNEDELIDILALMARKKGYTLCHEAEEKCRHIFAQVCKQADFGNGRYARNLLEQAIMKQSLRLIENSKGKIEREELLQLRPEDFNITCQKLYKEKRVLGFSRSA